MRYEECQCFCASMLPCQPKMVTKGYFSEKGNLLQRRLHQANSLKVTEKLERAMRFELTTPTLARLCSTPELRPLAIVGSGAGCAVTIGGI